MKRFVKVARLDFQEYNKYDKYLFIYYIYYLYPRLYTNHCKIILKHSKELLDYKVKNTKTNDKSYNES